MRKLSALAAVAILTGCASTPAEWRTEDTKREVFYAVALTTDAYTTAHFRDDPLHRAREGNAIARAIYGSRPEAKSVLATAVAVGLAHWIIARHLPEKWRPWWQNGYASIHAAAAAHNCYHNDVGC